MDDFNPFALLPVWRVALYCLYGGAFTLVGTIGLMMAAGGKALRLTPATRPIL